MHVSDQLRVVAQVMWRIELHLFTSFSFISKLAIREQVRKSKFRIHLNYRETNVNFLINFFSCCIQDYLVKY